MPNEATYKIELALAEIQSGNNLNALKLYEGLIANPKSQPGTLVSANFALARMYALMADKPNMQAAFRRGEATLERVRIFPAARPFLPSWFALREWARGELFLAQGKLDEAESALRRSVSGLEGLLKQSNSPERASSAIESGYLSVSGRLITVMTARGKLPEAELLARATLRTALTLRGKYHMITGLTLTRFADLLNEQGRFAYGAAMADAALDVFDRSGAPVGSGFRSIALSFRGDSLVAMGNWAEAARSFLSIRGMSQGDEVAEKVFRGTSSSLLAQIKVGSIERVLPNATRQLDQILGALGPNNTKTAEIRGLLAMALYASRDLPGALREFREATRVLLSTGAAATELSGLALRRIKVRQIIESYLALLHEISNTDLERAAGINAASESFRMADALLGEGSVQQALAASAARAAANQPGLGELIREEQDGK